jgi:predicted nucleotidyltransferase
MPRRGPEYVATAPPSALLRVQEAGSPAYRRAAQLATEAARLAREILGPTVEVIWFGSWPRGRAHERSDVDIAIRCPAGVPRDRLRRVREAIDELPTLYSIDVLDLRDASPVLAEEVERYGRPI